MEWTRRRSRPIRFAPRHRRDWRRLWRYCRCGLRWPCPDRFASDLASAYLPPAPAAVPAGPRPSPPAGETMPRAGSTTGAERSPRRPQPAGAPLRNQSAGWNAPTGSHLVGRAGRLTPAQAQRAGLGVR